MTRIAYAYEVEYSSEWEECYSPGSDSIQARSGHLNSSNRLSMTSDPCLRALHCASAPSLLH